MSNDNVSLPGDQDSPGSGADGLPQYPFPGGDGDQVPNDPAPGFAVNNPPSADKDDDDGFLGNLAEDAGDAALTAGNVALTAGKWTWKQVWPFIKLIACEIWGILYGYGILIFVPIPFPWFAQRQLAYRYVDPDARKNERSWWMGPIDRILAVRASVKEGAEKGPANTGKKPDEEMDLHFYSQPNLVVTIHLIWVGWLVAACELYNSVFENAQIAESITRGLVWFWLFVLCVTIIALGVQFGRVAFFFLTGMVVMLVMGVVIWEQVGEVTIFEPIRQLLGKIDLGLGWGVPMVMSLVLGISLLISTVWQQLDDRWAVEYQGNFLDHENFQQKDRSIQKGAKTFQQDWQCLVRKYLLFGFGDILVKDSRGEKVIERIEGIFYARKVSDKVRDRFKMTDVVYGGASADAEAEEEEEV